MGENPIGELMVEEEGALFLSKGSSQHPDEAQTLEVILE